MSTTSGRRETASASATDWLVPPHPQGLQQGPQHPPHGNYSDYSDHYSGGAEHPPPGHHRDQHQNQQAGNHLQGLQIPQPATSTSISSSISLSANTNTNTSINTAAHLRNQDQNQNQNQQNYQQNQSNTAYMQQHQQYIGPSHHDTHVQQINPSYTPGFYQVSGNQYNFVPVNQAPLQPRSYPQQPELGRIIEEPTAQWEPHYQHVSHGASADITKHHVQPAVQVTEIPDHQDAIHITATATETTNHHSSNYSGSFHLPSETQATSELPCEEPQTSNSNPDNPSSDPIDPQNSRSRDPTDSDTGRQPPSDNSSPAETRKRARVESSNEGDSAEPDPTRKIKPPRGRPRVATEGESQRDRRRKQIREAQRAYRNRKDQAILDLEAKVKKLEQANQNMAQEVSGFINAVNTQSSLQHNPELSQRSLSLTHRMLASSTSVGQSVEGDGIRPAKSSESSASNDGFTFAAPSVQGRAPSMSQASGMASYNHYNPGDGSFEMITRPTRENASFPSYVPDPDNPGMWTEQTFLSHQLSNQVSGLLPSPRTYCDLEATFGRRLQRTSIERGLSLAMMDRPPPDIFGAVFGFCLLFETRQAIVKRLSGRLDILAKETLDNWTVPFPHLGGAGLHAQEAGSSKYGQPGGPVGNEGYVQTRQLQQTTGFSMGPWRPRIEEVRDANLDSQSRMNYPGYEGDFLDSDEVEVYLRQRNIHIPERADFVDVEIDLKDFESTNGAPIIRAPSTQQQALERDAVRETVKRAFEAQLDNPPSMALSTAGTKNFVEGSSRPADPFMSSSVPDASWATAMSPKLNTTMDISVLIEELANCSVCLGRTAGTRPKDIDRAVKIAVGMNEK